MGDVIDLRNEQDPRDAVHRVTQALASGAVVGVPTDTVPVPIASAVDDTAVAAILKLNPTGNEPLSLLLRHAEEVRDFADVTSGTADRLVRRLTPGAVTFHLPAGQNRPLFDALPEPTRKAITTDDRVSIRVPSGAFIEQILALSPHPLVALPDRDLPGDPDQFLNRLGPQLDLLVIGEPLLKPLATTIVAADREKFDILHAGAIPEAQIRQFANVIVVFVCTGNTCRSPMAEALLRHRLAGELKVADDELQQQGFIVVSAGLAAFPGSPASPEGIELLAADGIDLSTHSSQPLDGRLLEFADQIFTMTRQHRSYILDERPDVASRVELVSPEQRDISDPIGGGKSAYVQCKREIESAVDSIAGRLLRR